MSSRAFRKGRRWSGIEFERTITLEVARLIVEVALTTMLGEAGVVMQTYKHWELMDSLPAGWAIDRHAGSPLTGYEFATNGSPLRGGKRALVRVLPAQRKLFDAEVACSKMETTTYRQVKKPPQVVDGHYAKTANDLARAKFMRKLLADILVDMTICEIEGWCKRDYLNELVELINGIGRQTDAIETND